MTRILGSPPAAVRAVLERVVEKAVARRAPPPPWVAVDDGGWAWVEAVASAPAAERARGVVAASGEEAVRRAIRLGLGGALWLPPSTLAMEWACLAAAEAAPPPSVEPGLVDLVLDRGGWLALVTVARRWHDDLGEVELSGLLTTLAECLGVPPALVGLSALLTVEFPAGAMRSAWEGVVERVEWAAALELSVIPVSDPARDRNRVVSLAAALTLDRDAEAAGAAADGPGVVAVERGVTTPLTEVPAGTLRVPVWASRRPRPGSPTGVLLERMAVTCERRGSPLWIPLVDRSSLPFVLRLPGRLVLDGPAADLLSGPRSPRSPASPGHG